MPPNQEGSKNEDKDFGGGRAGGGSRSKRFRNERRRCRSDSINRTCPSRPFSSPRVARTSLRASAASRCHILCVLIRNRRNRPSSRALWKTTGAGLAIGKGNKSEPLSAKKMRSGCTHMNQQGRLKWRRTATQEIARLWWRRTGTRSHSWGWRSVGLRDASWCSTCFTAGSGYGEGLYGGRGEGRRGKKRWAL